MSFLKKIFKKKKGGTMLGNLIRGVAKKVSGGKLGTGKHMLKDDKSTEPDPKLIKVGSQVGDLANQLLTPVITEALTGNPVKSIDKGLLTDTMEAVTDTAVDSFWDSLKKKWYLLALPFGLILFAIWYARQPKKARRSYR